MGLEGNWGGDRIPEWVTGAEACFLTGDPPEVLRSKVMAGGVALVRPFGRRHGFVLLRTADLTRRRTTSVQLLEAPPGP